ncbi:MAG: dienelactone hydrolase family protein, partial [Clostridia bacterium]|nr:dienelactone hydrolase family protein [Clostridia bacterium]
RKPIGPYKVGTMTYDLTDETRVELYGDRQGDARKIRIQLWYPTNSDVKGSIARWIEDGTVVPRGLMEKFNAPAFVYDHLTLIDSNSHTDAPLKEDIASMPVVVISHGWTGFRNLHTDLGEMFASMGYLAVSIDHTYGSVGLVFDDGESASTDPEALPDRDDTDAFLTYAGNLVDTYSKDAGTVLEHLSYLNEQSEIFAGHIDLERVGAIGHSTGGGGVVKQAIENPMIDVVIGLDPWVEPIGRGMLSYGIKQPAIFFRSSSWTGGINEDYIKILTDNESADITKYEITGSKHQDFSMLYQMGPLPAILGISGKPRGYESADIQQAFIANFMNHWLLGEEDETESLMNEYDLVFVVK